MLTDFKGKKSGLQDVNSQLQVYNFHLQDVNSAFKGHNCGIKSRNYPFY